jgi:prevent-host-death family protein
MSKTVAVADSNLATLVDEVARTKEEIVVTQNGEPVAVVIPLSRSRGPMHGTIDILGDILSASGETWESEAMSGTPVVPVIPMKARKRMTLDELRASGRIIGDIEEPILEWDPERW